MNTRFSTRAARTLAGAAVLLSFPLAALADPAAQGNPQAHTADIRYFAAHVGMNKLANWPGEVNFGGPVVAANLELSPGANIGLIWGKQRERARYEIEYQHGNIDIDRVTLGTRAAAVDASGSYDVLTANALHQRSYSQNGTVYAGLGVGIGRVKLPTIDIVPNCNCLSANDKTGFVWQVRTGIEHRITASGLVFGQIGYLKVPGPKSEDTAGASYRNRGFAVLSVGYRHQY